MCSTELKALFDPASGRDPSLEKIIANDKKNIRTCQNGKFHGITDKIVPNGLYTTYD